VVVVDDEALAREKLRTLLAEHDDVELLAECSNGAEAVEAIARERPDVVFLDVQMPELDGFAVLEALEPDTAPTIVFVTAYDHYAIQAFEVHALDYLLKPFDRERFVRTLDHVRAALGHDRHDLGAHLRALLRDVRREDERPARLLVKSGGRVTFVTVSDVDWIQAAGNYVEIHAGNETHLLRETLKNLEARLDPEQFVRVHRSIVVNLDRVKHMDSGIHGEYVITLRDGRQLQSGRGFGERLRERIERGR
jgi:two-component system LytT family response regulator